MGPMRSCLGPAGAQFRSDVIRCGQVVIISHTHDSLPPGSLNAMSWI